MGYQEVAIKVKSQKDIKDILAKVKNNQMEPFIDLIGCYKKQNLYKYAVFGTDRHPGADFLKGIYKARCFDMEDVYSKFEEKFEYISLQEN